MATGITAKDRKEANALAKTWQEDGYKTRIDAQSDGTFKVFKLGAADTVKAEARRAKVRIEAKEEARKETAPQSWFITKDKRAAEKAAEVLKKRGIDSEIKPYAMSNSGEYTVGATSRLTGEQVPISDEDIKAIQEDLSDVESAEKRQVITTDSITGGYIAIRLRQQGYEPEISQGRGDTVEIKAKNPQTKEYETIDARKILAEAKQDSMKQQATFEKRDRDTVVKKLKAQGYNPEVVKDKSGNVTVKIRNPQTGEYETIDQKKILGEVTQERVKIKDETRIFPSRQQAKIGVKKNIRDLVRRRAPEGMAKFAGDEIKGSLKVGSSHIGESMKRHMREPIPTTEGKHMKIGITGKPNISQLPTGQNLSNNEMEVGKGSGMVINPNKKREVQSVSDVYKEVEKA